MCISKPYEQGIKTMVSKTGPATLLVQVEVLYYDTKFISVGFSLDLIRDPYISRAFLDTKAQSSRFPPLLA